MAMSTCLAQSANRSSDHAKRARREASRWTFAKANASAFRRSATEAPTNADALSERATFHMFRKPRFSGTALAPFRQRAAAPLCPNVLYPAKELKIECPTAASLSPLLAHCGDAPVRGRQV